MTWLILTSFLKRFRIHNCEDLEEIISVRGLREFPAVMWNIIPFARLEYLIIGGWKAWGVFAQAPYPSPIWKKCQYGDALSFRGFHLIATVDWNVKWLLRVKSTGGISFDGMIKPPKMNFFPVSSPWLSVNAECMPSDRWCRLSLLFVCNSIVCIVRHLPINELYLFCGCRFVPLIYIYFFS